ncbi:MAG: M42 family metallopeptidase [Oscillospiraceae bacterium]|nr:M42 family metallopeptidase [Oscillospiraceae bacterium]
MENFVNYSVEQAVRLLAIDSPSGYTKNAADYVVNACKELGITAEYTTKGGVIFCINPEAPVENALLLEAHVDTLGGMVTEIFGNGRLHLTNLGGMNPNNAEAENVRIITRSGKIYTGTFQLKNASIHVNGDYKTATRSFDTMEVVIDEEVSSRADVEKLGIMPGDIVCFEPRTMVTESGYIKSRFLDDKLSVAILLGLAKAMKEGKVNATRRVWCHVTVFEEVGHGGSASVPAGVSEAISVDMGCVGNGLGCDERMVSICAKDSGGPYHYEVVSALIDAAKRGGADFAVDVYPFYGSDVEATLRAGHDLRHGLIGPGVYASHGYERSHKKGVENTLKLLAAYLG